jgi:RND family efflux transporter MFP subunit
VAPFAGTVEEHLAQRGEQVGPGTPVVRLVSTRDVQVTAGIPERYAGDIQSGDAVQVRMQMAGGEMRTGRIAFVGSAVNPQSRTFPVEIALSNPDGRLKPAMTATVLLRREQIEDALVVPRSAVVREADGEVVYVVEGGVARSRRVVTGSSFGERVVVETGLSAGDEVIVLGQNNVAPGDRVAVASQRRSLGGVASPVATPAE